MVLDPPDGWEALHGVLRAGHLPGLLLPGQPDPGRGGHGLRRAEPGHHRGEPAEGGGVPGHAGAAEEAAGGGAGKGPPGSLSALSVRRLLRPLTQRHILGT